jgi:hypothetical protein
MKEITLLWEVMIKSNNPNTPIYNQDEMQALMDQLDYAIEHGTAEDVEEIMSRIDDVTTSNFQ